MNSFLKFPAAVAVLMAISGSVQAQTYEFSIQNPEGDIDAGVIQSVNSSFDTESNHFNWQSTIKQNDGEIADGFWLVVNDGPAPEYYESAIFYADAKTSNLSAYVYTGENSWENPNTFIKTFGGSFETDTSVQGQVSFNFSIDVSDINSYLPTHEGSRGWQGTQYGESIGVWYRPVIFDDAPNYNADGSIASLNYETGSWFDAPFQETAVSNVPEPGTFALAGLGIASVFLASRRRKKLS